MSRTTPVPGQQRIRDATKSDNDDEGIMSGATSRSEPGPYLVVLWVVSMAMTTRREASGGWSRRGGGLLECVCRRTTYR